MLLEALEILNSAGEDENSYITDFSIYKVMYILTVYTPVIVATFLLSQEYLGQKIACFAPENFTDSQAESLNEYCWNNGYWVSDDTPMVRSLYTQPHRYYPLYLPIQAVVFMSPIIMWNVMTKTQLLAILRSTEEFLEELQECVKEQSREAGKRAQGLMKQFHRTLTTAAQDTELSYIITVRLVFESLLTTGAIWLQFKVYNNSQKVYHCHIKELAVEEIMCTVPVLDLLDVIWSVQVAALLLALGLVGFCIYTVVKCYYAEYKPLFYHDLPYGSGIDLEEVVWDNNFTKHSYELLTAILSENNSIVTKAYVISSMKVADEEEGDTEDTDKEKCNRNISNDHMQENAKSEVCTKGGLNKYQSSIESSTSNHAKPSVPRRRSVDKTDGENNFNMLGNSIPKHLILCAKCGGPVELEVIQKYRQLERMPEIKPLVKDHIMLTALIFAGFIAFSVLIA